MNGSATGVVPSGKDRLPRVGALGLGWIGRKRLEAAVAAGAAEIVAICDTDSEAIAATQKLVPNALDCAEYEQLLDLDLDAVVIATPSALHAAECVQAFEHGLSVFCQKPLSRTLGETERVLRAARKANRLLRVDFSYRHCRALERVRDLVRAGELGHIHSVDLVFHNAYGPSAGWANDPTLAGGGCLMDLGIHLLDALGFVLGDFELERADARLYREGRRISNRALEIDEFATASLELGNGTNVQLACSWRSSFGADARIAAEFFGTRGGARFSNVDGSFYDFACDLHRGASRERLVSPPDDWGGRAFVAYLRELGERPEYTEAPEIVRVARVLDALYGRAAAGSRPELERAAGTDVAEARVS